MIHIMLLVIITIFGISFSVLGVQLIGQAFDEITGFDTFMLAILGFGISLLGILLCSIVAFTVFGRG